MEEKETEKKIIEGSETSNPNAFAEGIEIMPSNDKIDSEKEENKQGKEEIKNENEEEGKEKPIQEINIDKEAPKIQTEKIPEIETKKTPDEKKEGKEEKIIPKTDLEKSDLKMGEEIQEMVRKETGVIGGKEPKSLMRTVRTYQGDVAGILKNQKTSFTKMVIAEEERKRGKGKTINEKKKTRKTTTILGVFLIIVMAGAYLFLENQNSQPKTIIEIKIPTIIFPNYQREILLKNLEKRTITKTIKEEELNILIPLGSIMQLYLTREDLKKEYIVEQTEGYKIILTTEVFLNSLETKVSNSLTRALKPDFVFGYHSSLGNNPFLLFKVKSYENVYAGMLDWEKYMYNDLIDIFKRENSTLSLNEETMTFKDIVVMNKDVRAILNKEGKIEFAYSFPDKSTLVIANNKTTLEEIFRRVLMANLERKN
ncbi:hypothetical protein KKG48_01025 [Patescibacteria group bacterium]|nr:hypothetical protein [Patescibacteria group bacterium]MCG2695203.1 hypothetical protein [Candidatus Parcubacteria bacterium]